MRVACLTVGPLEENCWLLHDPASGEVVVIDPGDEPARIVAAIKETGSPLKAIWLTHAHFDHIGGIAGIHREWPGTPVFLHDLDQPVYAFGHRAAAAWGLPFEQPGPADRSITEGDTMSLGAFSFEVLHLPGHAPGHVGFLGEGHLFGGDVLFAGSVGRSDLPLSDPAALDRSLKRISSLPPETVVLPGHGPKTSIGTELRSNPFLNGAALAPKR